MADNDPTKQITYDKLARNIFLATVGGAIAFIGTVILFVLN